MFDTSKSILQIIPPNKFISETSILVKRDDLIDPIVSGNKWRKLKYSFQKAQQDKKDTIVTFGGAYSNHLIATAKAGNLAGFKTIGIVRGEELNANSNSILKQCASWGMELHFISRSEYFMKEDKAYLDDLHQQYPNSYIVPEGGASYYGMIGCQETWKELEAGQIDSIFLAAGTGTTTAGILMGAPEHVKVYCVPVLAGDFMRDAIKKQLTYALFDDAYVEEKMNQLVVLNDYHFGKYGKSTAELEQFITEVKENINLPLDKIYTGKAFFALVDSFRKGLLIAKNKCVFLHTGGI
jgi:1-aminocyclopropane-1-carboxylate deaminase